MRKLNYTQCGVICHGLSELSIVNYIKSHLHLKLEVFSKDKGHCSVQITSLMSFLDGRNFQSVSKFYKEYDVEHHKNKLINFKLFIIMDTDDCTEKQKQAFESKEMFKNHPLFDYIVPIFNVPNLESVLIKAGIMTKKIKDNEKGSYYLKTFPISKEPYCLDSFNEILTLKDKLIGVKSTNLDVFLDYCLSLVDKPDQI